MEENIRDLAALLPDEAIFEAARIHILELAKAGDLEKAAEFFAKLGMFPGAGLSRARAGRFLVSRYIFAGERGKALEIYNEAFADAENPEIFLEKLLTLDSLVRDFGPGRLREAFELWRPLGKILTIDGVKRHWAETGRALLMECRKTDDKKLAGEIYDALRERASCAQTAESLKLAENILKKMGL